MAQISSLKNFNGVKIIDGKKIALLLKKQMTKKIKNFKVKPALAVILVGNNAASIKYVALKEKFARDTGIKFQLFHYSAATNKKIVVEKIKKLNTDKKINGILVQLPLPRKLNPDKIIAAIAPEKDVDGFGPKPKITPGLDLSVLELIKAAKKNLKNKTAVILAKGDIFSSSLAKLLRKEKLKIKIVKPHERDLAQLIKKADLLITALGQPNFIKSSMVKRGAIMIDIGTTYKNGKIYGDISDNAGSLSSYISPVPGGVGPVTVAMLFVNLVKLAKKQK